MAIGAKDSYIVASRGFGKSEGIDAPGMIRDVFAMPRSAGAILSPTYAKLLQNTLPAVCHALSSMGFQRNIHYYVGRKPPKAANFKTPYIQPFSYDHVMSWYNGSILNLISFDRPMSANSMSLDYIKGFEAKYLDINKIRTEVLPANRGNLKFFQDCPWHHGQQYSTDMPTSKSGMWILEMENQMDNDLIEYIKLLYIELKRFEAKNNKSETDNNKIKYLRKELNFFRSKAVFFAEYDVFDNIELLGEDFVKNMKRDLPNLIFQTAILNLRKFKKLNGFYSALNENIHRYSCKNNSYLESLDYDFQKAQSTDCRHDGDIDKAQPLLIANDYNASINSIVTGQVRSRQLLTLSGMFVKTPRKLKDVCNLWCDYYHYHPKKEVVYYYDSTAIADTPLDGKSFAETVIEVLTSRGWNVENIYMGNPMKHPIKHEYINRALSGDNDFLFPIFNKDNCEYLLLAMDNAGVKIGPNGFQKDKSSEKEDDTPEDPDETKTHITDAWDTLFLGANLFPYYSDYNTITSTSWNN